MATTFAFASLVHAVATSALVAPAGAATPASRMSAATAPVVAEDDVRARVHGSWPGGAIGSGSFP